MTVVLGLALLIPFLMPTTGTEGIPTILQQVRIGDVPLIPNTGMTPPIALLHPQPMYTFEAFQAGIIGTVTVRAEFDIEGHFQVVEVVDSPGYGLEEAALAALDNWRFRPAYRSGRRVAVMATIDVEFDASTAEDRLLVQALRARDDGQTLRARLLLEALIGTFPSSPHLTTALSIRDALSAPIANR